MNKDAEARAIAAQAKRNQEMARDLVVRVESGDNQRARAARHDKTDHTHTP